MAQLQWRDDDDVYKPINYPLSSFLESQGQLIDDRQGRNSLSQRIDRFPEMLVFVTQSAEDQLIHHLSVDPNNETGGALVGNAYYCPTEQTHYTEIIGSISALYTVGNRVHFRFTPECWQEILRIQKDHYPRTTIVGWYHSHPGHGIFLSGIDLNTQRLSFGKTWQIATVYDPIRHEIGYFHGGQGKRLNPVYLNSPPLSDETSGVLANITSETSSPRREAVPLQSTEIRTNASNPESENFTQDNDQRETLLNRPPISSLSEETLDSRATRRIELPQIPRHEVVSSQSMEDEINFSNPESETFTQDDDHRESSRNTGWSIISIFDGLNYLLEQFFCFILGGRR